MTEQNKHLYVFRLFPLLALWFRFPGLLCWAAVSSGIITATFIAENLSHSQSIIQIFYIIRIISAICSLSSIFLFSSRAFRYFSFFTLALVQLVLRTSEQQTVFTLIEQNQLFKTNQIIFGKIVSYPMPFRKGCKFLIRCDSASFDSNHLLKGKLLQCISAVNPVSISKVTAYGRCFNPVKPIRPNEFNEPRYLLSKNIWAKMEIDSIHVFPTNNITSKLANHFRERVLTILDRLHQAEHRGILQAAFLGEVEYLSYDTKESFRRSGIYHLLSISGLHASMIIAATYFFLIFIPVGKNTKHIIALMVLWTYLLFIGFIPSLFRATIMATLIICSFLFQKKNYSMQSIGLAATLWLLYSPESLFLPGFQLSFFATIGIILISPVLNRFCPETPSPVWNYLLSRIISLFNISFSGFLSTLPILIFHFGTISLFGLIANLAAVSLMSISMWSFFMCLIFESFINFLSSIAINISAMMLELLIWISKLSNQFPWSSVIIGIPWPEMIVLYALFLIGFVSIVKKYTMSYLKWGIPVFLLIIPIDFLLRTRYNEMHIERFITGKCNAIVICWPHKGVWLLGNCSSRELSKLYNFSIRNWIRHKRNAYLERIYILDSSLSKEITEIPPAIFDTTIKQKFNLLPLASKKNATSRIQLSVHSSINSQNIELQIFCKNDWIKCSLTDSTVIYGDKSDNANRISVFPVLVKVPP